MSQRDRIRVFGEPHIDVDLLADVLIDQWRQWEVSADAPTDAPQEEGDSDVIEGDNDNR